MDNLLSEAMVRKLKDPDVARLVVALSGGVDSVSLVHAVSALNLGKPVVAIHIDHHLQDISGEFASLAIRVCERLRVECCVREVTVKEKGSLETIAREARYEAFESFLRAGDLLLLAHHADDQVETVLFRLFRGSRVAGLEGMPIERGIGSARLLRPLLGVTKDQILAYARHHDLNWIDDPMNTEMLPDRNYIRHQVMPVIEARWPEVRSKLLKSLEGDIRSRESLQGKYRQLLAETCNDTGGLVLDGLVGMDDRMLADVLTAWILEAGAPMPSGRLLTEVSISVSRRHLVDVATGQLEIRQHDDSIYLLKPLPPPDVAGFSLYSRSSGLKSKLVSSVMLVVGPRGDSTSAPA